MTLYLSMWCFIESCEDNDFLISFDEMAILAKAYQDKVNVKQDESLQIVKSNKKIAPATAQKKKTKTKKIN